MVRVLDLFDGSTSTVVLPDATSVSAPELAREGRWLAAALRSAGLAPGDRVAVQLSNGLTYLRLLVACAAARLVLVSVNTRFTETEAADLIRRSGAGFVVRSVDGLDSITAGATGSRVLLDDGQPHDPFVVFTTSGTTSRPKLVRHTQKSIAEHGRNASLSFGYDELDTALIVMPLCGTFGLSSLTAALAGNCRIVLTDRFDPLATGQLIESERVTVVNGSDDMFHRLLDGGADMSSIRMGGYARFNSSLDGITARADERKCTLIGLYGMSEVQALFAHRFPVSAVADRERAGGTLVSEAARFRIVDGELQLRGPSMFEGYLAEGGDRIDTDLMDSAFANRWFRTGDSAHADDDRTFTYLSRLGDSIRLGGFLVAPAEIESALLSFDGVTGAQVVAVERPGGARPVAFVTGQPTMAEKSMISALRNVLAVYKIPVRIVRLDAFPTTPSANGDKIQLGRLRADAATLLNTPTREGEIST